MKKLLLSAAVLLAVAGCKDDSTAAQNAQKSKYPDTTIGFMMGVDAPGSNFYDIVMQTLHKIEADNPNLKVLEYNAKSDAAKQREQIEEAINKGAKALVINLVDFSEKGAADIVNLVCHSKDKIPAVYFDLTPGDRNLAKCETAYFVGTDNARVGTAQGMQILKAFNEGNMDKNGDDTVQYVLIEGVPGTEVMRDRSSWVIRTIENYPNIGKKAEEIFRAPANNDENKAYELISQWSDDERFKEVEVVIVNNDAMALGALRALKEKGLQLPVYGIDGTAQGTKELAGTTPAGIGEVVKVSMRVATNLATGHKADENVDVQVDNKVIKIAPYSDEDK